MIKQPYFINNKIVNPMIKQPYFINNKIVNPMIKQPYFINNNPMIKTLLYKQQNSQSND